MTFIFSLLLTLALALISVPGEAATPVTTCGTVINAAGDYQLTGNLGPCAGDGVVITASNVTLDLAGFTITGMSSLQSCNLNTPQYGINVTAAVTNVHISGGTVTNFVDGVVLFASQSRANALTLSDNCVFGIAVTGDGNVIDTNTVTGSGVDGVGVAGVNNTVQANTISGNWRYGADLGGDGNHTVRDNLFANNGVVIQGGEAVAVFAGNNTKILHNLATGNFDGIFLQTAWNLVQDNTVTDNLSVGIVIGMPGASTVVQGNTATGNDVVDLADSNAACGSNTWRDNIFVTDAVNGSSDGGPATGCITGISPVPVSVTSVAGGDTAVPGGTGFFTAFPQSPAVSAGSLAFLGTGSGQAGVYLNPTDSIVPTDPIRVADLTTLILQGTGTFTGFTAVAAGDTFTSFLGTGGGGQTGVYLSPPSPISPPNPIRVADLTHHAYSPGHGYVYWVYGG